MFKIHYQPKQDFCINLLHTLTDGGNGMDSPNLKKKPPVMKNSLTPRYVEKSKKVNDEPITSKPWSPTYSSPDLKMLMQLEKEKMKSSGYLRDEPRMLFSPNKSLSMPSLNDVDDCDSERSFQAPPKKIITQGRVKLKMKQTSLAPVFYYL